MQATKVDWLKLTENKFIKGDIELLTESSKGLKNQDQSSLAKNCTENNTTELETVDIAISINAICHQNNFLGASQTFNSMYIWQRPILYTHTLASKEPGKQVSGIFTCIGEAMLGSIR